ncbi:MAG: phasin family protein [Alphaproteobacteria bacterium]|nr:phasin family protein [Alphaproteobacteria bacterium]
MVKGFTIPEFDFTKAFEQMKVPGFDATKLMSSYQRNVEAVSSANQKAAEHFQSIMSRQAELMREAMTEATDAVKDMSGAASPEARAKRQAELVKGAFEKALANMKEIADMTAKANKEIYDLLNERMAESVAEFRGEAKAAKPKK